MAEFTVGARVVVHGLTTTGEQYNGLRGVVRSASKDGRHAVLLDAPHNKQLLIKIESLKVDEGGATEGSRVRFVVGPLAGRAGEVLRSNSDNDAQWIVRLDDGSLKKVAKAKIDAVQSPTTVAVVDDGEQGGRASGSDEALARMAEQLVSLTGQGGAEAAALLQATAGDLDLAQLRGRVVAHRSSILRTWTTRASSQLENWMR